LFGGRGNRMKRDGITIIGGYHKKHTPISS
jgi:hypothetical protein